MSTNIDRMRELTLSNLDDGIIDVYLDKDGVMRGDNGWFMNERNLDAIDRALDSVTNITGIEFNEVQNEFESELSFHKVGDFANWGLAENVKGIATVSRDGLRNHVYWEPTYHHRYAEHIIFHELAHTLGIPELDDPFSVYSHDDVMGYIFTGGQTEYRDINVAQLTEIYG